MSIAANSGGRKARSDDRAGSRLPVTLLGGFLGSGKTTLLSRLLHHERLRDTAVVINEFGEIALDHLLVASVDAQTVLLDGGCVCCAVRDDLAETLLTLYARRESQNVPAFNRVVIETSGLADPTAIAALLLRDPALARRFELDAVIVTVDALHALGQLDTQPEALRQVMLADRLLLTKTDLIGEDDYWKLCARLHALNPAAPRLNCRHGEIDPRELIDLRAGAALHAPKDVAHWHASPPQSHAHEGCSHCGDLSASAACTHVGESVVVHDASIRAHCIRIDASLEWDVLSSWLGAVAFHHGDKLLRLKAIVHVRGEPLPVAMHGVQRWLNEPESLPDWPDADRSSRFVFIVRDLPRSVLEAALAAAQRDAAEAAPSPMRIADLHDLAKNGRASNAPSIAADTVAVS